MAKKQSRLNSSCITKTRGQSTLTTPIMLTSTTTEQTQCDSSKTTCENNKLKSKKSSKSMKRPAIHKDGQLKKNGQKKSPLMAKAIDQQQQRLHMLQQKRRQVWLQLLPQITAKKDRIMATKTERIQRLRLMAFECQKQWHKYSKQKHRKSVQEPPLNFYSVVNTAAIQ
ncbi:hypothetical protein BLA29_009814 [Euroglyphus maynei]|uniref:Uncharacterized protein n=1 Tax=Euroglyphus maynei TaxID=6958 RepID=A0A1Y3AN74_EURMA|nr:hypothetical protein BLA29_009814 [Euroglyphus maynei]